MTMILTLWKQYDETMTEVLTRGLSLHNLDEPATYAGRLDVAASGIVVLLTGEDRFLKQHYLNCDKQYYFQVVLGISTDTGDIFGVVQSINNPLQITLPPDFAQQIQSSFLGTRTVQLPAYSAYRFQGKPLWSHARAGVTPAVHKNATIHSFEYISLQSINSDLLHESVTELASNPNLHGYRQSDIAASWDSVPRSTQITTLTIAVTVSSGTFIRTLATQIGELLKVPACAYAITRTGIALPDAHSTPKWIHSVSQIDSTH
jgi:tRNA pseudouridine(55) synthase